MWKRLEEQIVLLRTAGEASSRNFVLRQLCLAVKILQVLGKMNACTELHLFLHFKTTTTKKTLQTLRKDNLLQSHLKLMDLKKKKLHH